MSDRCTALYCRRSCDTISSEFLLPFCSTLCIERHRLNLAGKKKQQQQEGGGGDIMKKPHSTQRMKEEGMRRRIETAKQAERATRKTHELAEKMVRLEPANREAEQLLIEARESEQQLHQLVLELEYGDESTLSEPPSVEEEEEDELGSVADPINAVARLVDHLTHDVTHFFFFGEHEFEGEASVQLYDLDDMRETLSIVTIGNAPASAMNAFTDEMRKILSDRKLFRALVYNGDQATTGRIRERIVTAIVSTGLSPYVTRRMIAWDDEEGDQFAAKLVSVFIDSVENIVRLYNRKSNEADEEALRTIRKKLDRHTKGMPDQNKERFVALVKDKILRNDEMSRYFYYHEHEGGARRVRSILENAARVVQLQRYIVKDRGWFQGWYSEEEESQ